MRVPTIRIKHDQHPDGVLINESEFDEDVHEVHGETSADAGAPKKLKVEEMRALLTARGVDIPEGAKKPDLQALVDALD